MARPFSLTGRSAEILHAVVKTYIATGQAVGSRTLSDKRKDHLSPASIRNAMAELEAEGYLSHPHTSAGRLPTDKGLRFYVENLGKPRLQRSEADLVQANLREATTLEDRLGRSSRLLAELTRQIGIVVMAPLSQAVLRHIQFQRLSEGRILVVLVSSGDVVQHRIVRVEEQIPIGELERIAGYLNGNFAGWKLVEARAEILRRIEEERAAYDAVLRRLRLLWLAGFLGTGAAADAQVYLEGTPNLVDAIRDVDAGRLRELLRALEEKERLVALLDECIREDMRLVAHNEAAGKPICIRIGLEDAHPAMKHLALIGAVCAMEPGLEGRIAVLGPTRMPYERVMSAVAQVARAFYSLAESN